MIASYSNLTSIPWVTGALQTPWDLILLKRLYKKKQIFKFCRATITRTSSIKELGLISDSKLHFHKHADDVFSECIKLLGLILSITYSFPSLECMYVLYFTLIRPKLEHVSVVWNPITCTDANKLERIQQRFTPICFIVLFLMFLLHTLLPRKH
jgi:hypothetical protein